MIHIFMNVFNDFHDLSNASNEKPLALQIQAKCPWRIPAGPRRSGVLNFGAPSVFGKLFG
jgi:hypothetical protein